MNGLPRTTFGHAAYHISRGKPQSLWDDTLMMTVMPLAKTGILLKKPRYVEEAKRQFLLHIQSLYDSSTGLFFRGWQFDESVEGGVGHIFARSRWARGNSWSTIATQSSSRYLSFHETTACDCIWLVYLRRSVGPRRGCKLPMACRGHCWTFREKRAIWRLRQQQGSRMGF